MKPLCVEALYLFGSYARDEARVDSDVDVFIDKAPGKKFGFEEFMAAYDLLKEALPDADIQYGTQEGLSSTFELMSSAKRFVSCNGCGEKSARAPLSHSR
ncbi:nucleotidyltransferase domain-containing protein [Mesorhizobium sp. WSM2239]|uniref:Nucleotidyltransferase domain-containing protein n=2 Tax=unclassified Mesorhizobium TaxID=325217 RepID=A0AAU8DG34_9HYPH